MDLRRKKKDTKVHSKKDKKLKKLISKSESDSDESEHELSYYLNDRVKLMKEVLKIIKPKKIKSMAPECIKNLDNEEVNSMLLEELLGISNKRLKYIFNGQNLEEDSSSTDPEAEQQPIDVISLDDITDDDFVIDLDSENENNKKRHKKHGKIKIKEECKRKKVKKEKQDKTDHSKSSKKSKDPDKDKMDEQNLMSVLELLELQARARAIRSQLALESSKKAQEQGKSEAKEARTEGSDNDDAIIIESPKNIEIVITSSDSETEDKERNSSEKRKNTSERENNCGEIGSDKTSQKGIDLKEDSVKESENAAKKKFNSTNESSKPVKSSSESGQKLESDDHDEKDVLEETSESREKEFGKSENKNTEVRNKIINVETVIITPAKNAIVSSNVERNKEKENEKSSGNSEDSEKTKSKYKELENEKDNSSHSKIYKSETNVADESDGIILNMEQSEIDCIISD
ncbi:myb-like protein X [Anoplophora glabripennis]|uniref:myb-like protein X n=1 Tax=Anoplophora glabripennis TaxID=217634 RepID=UPI000873D650|nr:myb-like protein X [Anoplophora glabripennis]